MGSMNILALFAHPDDEIGCIATLKKHAARGDDVMLVWTTYGELASQFGDASHEEVQRTRAEHGRVVAEMVGARYRFFDFGDTRMTASRAESLEVARLYCEFKPDAVITWDDFNRHPDHRATAKVAFDAITLARIPKVVNEGSSHRLEAHRKPVAFYQYPVLEASRPFVHVDVSDTFEVAQQVRQFYADFYKWEWSSEEFRSSRATWGRAVGVKYAERFSVQRAYHPPLEYLI
jgi:N-acetylglucosamine malate deacetylase 1